MYLYIYKIFLLVTAALAVAAAAVYTRCTLTRLIYYTLLTYRPHRIRCVSFRYFIFYFFFICLCTLAVVTSIGSIFFLCKYAFFTRGDQPLHID